MSDDDIAALIAFNEARLDEDEAAARAFRSPDWEHYGDAVHMSLGGGSRLVAHCPLPHGGEPSPGEHIARHDPARVLAEVAAKRRILAEVVLQIDQMDESIEGEWGMGNGPAGESRLLLHLLTLPYAAHPDYRAEWARSPVTTFPKELAS